jgi:hypothetical protein
MSDERSTDDFGCARCWPPEADDAWNARRTLTWAADLIDESHFHVMVLVCPSCGQRFVSVFTETIDWVDGDDPQDWTLLPITTEEADDLALQGASLSESTLNGLGPGRRSLRRDYGKGAQPLSVWSTGLYVGHHD